MFYFIKGKGKIKGEKENGGSAAEGMEQAPRRSWTWWPEGINDLISYNLEENMIQNLISRDKELGKNSSSRSKLKQWFNCI